MKWLFRTASAAALSFFLLGSAYAGGSFQGVTLTVHDMTLMGASTSMNIDANGNYTVTTDGGVAQFIAIRAKGTLTPDQIKSLQNMISKADAGNPPADLPGLVPGSPGFTISWNDNGTQRTVSGATNIKAAIEDAKQQHEDISGWTVMKPFFTKLSTLESSVEKAYNPVAPVSGKKAPFDELKIEETSTFGPGGVPPTHTLDVKSDGSYTLTTTGDPALGQKTTTISGQLTADQLASLVKAYKQNTLAKDNGKYVGGLVPDANEFTITATEGGKTYSVRGSVDGNKLGPLQALEKVLNGDLTDLHPTAAQPLEKDSSIPDDATSFFNRSSASRTAESPSTIASARAERASRTDGLNGVLKSRVEGEAAKTDGKEVTEDGGK